MIAILMISPANNAFADETVPKREMHTSFTISWTSQKVQCLRFIPCLILLDIVGNLFDKGKWCYTVIIKYFAMEFEI